MSGGDRTVRAIRGRRCGAVDRRALYLTMFLAVAAPFLLPPMGSAKPQAESRAFFERIDAAATSGRPLLFSIDYTPETEPEVGPIAVAALRHALGRGAKCVTFTPHQDSAGLARSLANRVVRESGQRYGDDLVHLGFKPEIRPLILGMANEIRDNFPVDHRGTPLDELPLTRNLHRLQDFELVISISADDLSLDWITFGHGRVGARLAFGVASNFYGTIKPFVESGQVEAVVRGMKGAAEYESLLVEAGLSDALGDGTRGMGSQTAAHALILLLIVAGNFLARTRREES